MARTGFRRGVTLMTMREHHAAGQPRQSLHFRFVQRPIFAEEIGGVLIDDDRDDQFWMRRLGRVQRHCPRGNTKERNRELSG